MPQDYDDEDSEQDYDDEDPERETGEGEPGKPLLARKGDVARLVGVEVEYNNRVNISRWARMFRGGLHRDSSCGVDDCSGYEAVTAPMAGHHIAASLKALSAALIAGGTGCDSTCGVHVHVDAADLGWHGMYRLLGVYSFVEPILYLCGGQQRAANRYAMTCGRSYAMALSAKDRKGAILAVAVKDFNTREPVAPSLDGAGGRASIRRINQKHSNGRYKGLNLAPWLAGRKHTYEGKQTAHGWKENSGKIRPRRSDCTVEFRMHRNTLDARRLIGWTLLCRDIVEFAANATDSDIANLPKSALRALCEVIAPGSKAWLLKRVREWRHATTATVGGKTSATGEAIAPRRIKLNGGMYITCAA